MTDKSNPTRRRSGPERAAKARKGAIGEQTAGAPPAQAEPRLLPEYPAESETHPVRFTLFHPGARQVFVAGNFNNWQSHATPMNCNPDGEWSVEIALNPGTYEYRYLIDGRWSEDPMSPRYVSNPYGGLNSVIEVKGFH